jgi:hypothetical protein
MAEHLSSGGLGSDVDLRLNPVITEHVAASSHGAPRLAPRVKSVKAVEANVADFTGAGALAAGDQRADRGVVRYIVQGDQGRAIAGSITNESAWGSGASAQGCALVGPPRAIDLRAGRMEKRFGLSLIRFWWIGRPRRFARSARQSATATP